MFKPDLQLEPTVRVRSHLLRALVYVLIAAGLAFVPSLDLVIDVRGENDQLFHETSMVEIGQKVALLTAALAALIGVLRRVYPAVCGLLLLAAASALVRELDFMLDAVFDGAWQVMLTAVLLAAGLFAWHKRQALRAQVPALIRHFSFGLLLAGSMIVLGFSRVFGRGDFWRKLMGDGYERSIKNLAEEGLELLGFTIIAIGVVEFVAAASRQRRDRERS